ncbi:MAG TPA: penicillin acylase family protein [Polyangiaceae bacterium]|nr:penicillin acylase family protein [Polyangiaceae bacterium]
MRTLQVFGLVTAVAALLGCGDDEATKGSPGGGGQGGAGAAGGAGGAGVPGVQIDGLSAPVNAYLDDRGMLSVDCQTNADCIASLGYFHARDRFVQMDLRRRITTGRLTQMLGAGVRATALPIDFENRARYSTRSGEPLEDSIYEQSDAESKAMMVAYASGVNAWIADVRAGRNGAQFPREYQHPLLFDYDPERIPDWKPSDSVATILALINSLTNRASLEIEWGKHRADLKTRFGDAQGELMFRDLFDVRPDIDSPILPGFSGATASLWRGPGLCAPRGNPELAPSRGQNEGSPKWLLDPWMSDPSADTGIGSNNWIVGPQNSATGNAFMANDPHLGMSNPALAYIAHLDSKTNGSGDLHVAGLTFAGMPFVLVGQNEHLSWGTTNTNFDLTDVYVEEVSPDGNSVSFKNSAVPIIKKLTTFALSDGTTVDKELQFVPHHGPVLPRADASDPMLTMRWAGNDISTDVNFLMGIARAKDVYEAKSALESITGVGSNWVIADTKGNIAYLPYNKVPKRPWATGLAPTSGTEAVPWLPLDGRGEFEWEGHYAYGELPQAINPPQGYLATANNDMTGGLFDGDPTNDSPGVFQTSVAPGYRHKRIMDLLGAKDAHDMASMEALISDTYSLIGEQLVPHLLAAASGLSLTESGKKVQNALKSWSFECPTGLEGPDGAKSPLSNDASALVQASGCAAFHVLLRDLNDATVKDEGVAAERGPHLVVVKMLKGEATAAGEIYWDDVSTKAVVETKDDIVAAAYESAGKFLVGALGSDETRWAWGRIHALTMRSDVDTASSGLITEYNESGFANNGGLFTVDVANPVSDMTQAEGAALRFVCEALPTGPSCVFQLPGGQSGHVDSEHYQDSLPDYLSNTSRPLQMDVAAAASSAVERVTFTPPP